MGRKKIINDEREKVVIQMYQENHSIKSIAENLHMSKERIRTILKTNNIEITHNRSVYNRDDNVMSVTMEQKNVRMCDKITRAEIEWIRHCIPIGFEFTIKTPKGIGPINSSNVNTYDAEKKVMIVDKSNHNFCQVKLLGTNLYDSVPWSTLIVMKRRGIIHF